MGSSRRSSLQLRPKSTWQAVEVSLQAPPSMEPVKKSRAVGVPLRRLRIRRASYPREVGPPQHLETSSASPRCPFTHWCACTDSFTLSCMLQVRRTATGSIACMKARCTPNSFLESHGLDAKTTGPSPSWSAPRVPISQVHAFHCTDSGCSQKTCPETKGVLKRMRLHVEQCRSRADPSQAGILPFEPSCFATPIACQYLRLSS